MKTHCFEVLLRGMHPAMHLRVEHRNPGIQLSADSARDLVQAVITDYVWELHKSGTQYVDPDRLREILESRVAEMWRRKFREPVYAFVEPVPVREDVDLVRAHWDARLQDYVDTVHHAGAGVRRLPPSRLFRNVSVDMKKKEMEKLPRATRRRRGLMKAFFMGSE